MCPRPMLDSINSIRASWTERTFHLRPTLVNEPGTWLLFSVLIPQLPLWSGVSVRGTEYITTQYEVQCTPQSYYCPVTVPCIAVAYDYLQAAEHVRHGFNGQSTVDSLAWSTLAVCNHFLGTRVLCPLVFGLDKIRLA